MAVTTKATRDTVEHRDEHGVGEERYGAHLVARFQLIPLHRSAPIIYDVDVGPVVARFVGPVHRDALDLNTEATGKQGTVGFMTTHICSGDQDLHSFRSSQSFAGVQQPLEVLSRVWPRPDRSELDVAGTTPGFGFPSAVTDREPGEPGVILEQHSITEILAGYRTNLARHVKAVVDGTRHFAAGLQSLLSVTL